METQSEAAFWKRMQVARCFLWRIENGLTRTICFPYLRVSKLYSPSSNSIIRCHLVKSTARREPPDIWEKISSVVEVINVCQPNRIERTKREKISHASEIVIQVILCLCPDWDGSHTTSCKCDQCHDLHDRRLSGLLISSYLSFPSLLVFP
jgi:hypothetical protein